MRIITIARLIGTVATSSLLALNRRMIAIEGERWLLYHFLGVMNGHDLDLALKVFNRKTRTKQ